MLSSDVKIVIDRVDRRVFHHRADARLRIAAPRAVAIMSTGLTTLASAATDRPHPRLGLSREGRHVQPQLDARVGREDAGPARVGDDGDAGAAAGMGCVANADANTNISSIELGADHPALREQRLDRAVRARERAGVRHGRARAGGRAARLHREDRLLLRHAPGDLHEPLRVAEALEVHEDDVRPRVVLPHSSRSFPDTSALLPSETNIDRPEAELATSARGSPRRARRTATRTRCCRQRLGGGRERCLQPDGGVRVDDAHAVRTDHAGCRTGARCRRPSLHRGARLAHFLEARRDDDEPLDALPPARLHRGGDVRLGTAMIARSTGSGIASTVG